MSPQDHAHTGTGSLADLQKLIRCHTLGPDAGKGVRYVALEQFSLWENMMFTRHGIECSDLSVGLWVPAEEFHAKEDIYLHSGDVEPVTRFDFSIFDDIHHYTYTASRFVPNTDGESFRMAMMAHIPDNVRLSNRFSFDTHPGYYIQKVSVTDRNNLVLGIYQSLNDIF